VIPNPWDLGSAKLLEQLGFEALATTSSGFAASLGRLDGGVTRDEAIGHAGALVAATGVPVSADLENGFAHDPADVAETVRLAGEVGLAGCSIEDWAVDADPPLYEFGLAVDRVRAAGEAAAATGLVLTARAENHLRGGTDLGDTIARLQAFQEAGADVLYAPGLVDLDQIRALVSALDRPVNVLIRPGGPTVPELESVGVRRVSVGGALALVAYGSLVDAARELLERGTHGFSELAGASATSIRSAFSTPRRR
jgi:2-methylisocitrate lyase-like PEP mutase family enzyme